MTAIGLALDGFLQSGACPAMVRGARARSTSPATVRAAKDYCLSDLDGHRVGTITAAQPRPVLGSNGPTVLLKREWEK